MPITVDDVVRVASRDDLSTYDPYDMWKTSVGFHCKNFFNQHRLAGLAPAAVLEVLDLFVNDRWRLFYSAQEYPIARAWAAMCLLNLHTLRPEAALLRSAEKHLDWLVTSAVDTAHGKGWGLAFRYAVDRNMIYGPEAVFSTMSLYPVEAFEDYTQATGDERYLPTIRSALDFFHKDLVIMEATDRRMATSYTNTTDRVVTNAVSYAMYAHAKMLRYKLADEASLIERIGRMFQFIVDQQRPDGSWLYSPMGRSFVDVFHSCIVIKNILKTDAIVALPHGREVARKGYAFLKENLLDPRTGLYRRFAVRNKPTIIAFDLYDNAEMMSLALIMGDRAEAERLSERIDIFFVRGTDVWSKASSLRTLHCRNTLRWAVLPYFFALTKLWAARGS